jgi:hypothetical protein
MEAAAFCAGVMLYRILAKVHPYTDDATIFQDMREGVFLPPHLAAPGLNPKLCELIQAALLLPVANKGLDISAADIVSGFLEILIGTENQNVSILSLFRSLTVKGHDHLEKEKSRYLFRQNSFVKARRFIIRNKHAVIGVTAVALFALFIVVSTTVNVSQRPTTEGMASDTVIMAYYDAFSSLNHVFMEAIINGASKNDINVAVNYFAISRQRQAYDISHNIVPARVWRESGGELPAPDVFGVTDLTIRLEAEGDGMVIYRADYVLWLPEMYSVRRSDIITLRRDRRGNWRITEIIRNEG